MRKNQADVLIIGSGVGGMSAAALLAKEGFRVVVVEKLPRMGGRCSTLNYKGFKCTTGVAAIEVGGLVQELFQQVGADFNVIEAGSAFYRINGQTVEVPQREGMKHLLRASGAGDSSVEKVMSAVSKALQWKEPSAGIHLRDWLRQHSDHSGIMNVFQSLVKSVMMVNVEEVSARTFFRFVKTVKGINNFGYSVKGSVALPEALGQIVQQHGGEIWTSAAAVRIVSEDGIVQGALIQHEDREYLIEASVVISDIGPLKTVELVGKENLDQDYIDELNQKLTPASVISLQSALEKPLFAQNHLLIAEGNRINSVYQPTLLCPDLAPEGQHLMIASAIPDRSVDLTTEKGRKEEIERCLEDLKSLFGQFDQVATVLLTGVYQDYWPGMRAWPGENISIKTPIINLYNVGDGVKQGDDSALSGVVRTGMLVAEEITERMGYAKGTQKNNYVSTGR